MELQFGLHLIIRFMHVLFFQNPHLAVIGGLERIMHLISPQEKAHDEGLHEVAMGHNDVVIIPRFVDIVPASLHRLTELRGSVIHIAAGLPFRKPVMESA